MNEAMIDRLIQLAILFVLALAVVVACSILTELQQPTQVDLRFNETRQPAPTMDART